MALLQISEPGKSPAPHQYKRAVGIDLGTTNSLVAASRGSIVETLADEHGRHLLPSVVHYGESTLTTGSDALPFAASDALNTISSVKRLMGRSEKEVKRLGGVLPYRFCTSEGEGMPYIQTCKGNISPVQVSAEIIKTLKLRAEKSLGGELVGAVITVPAYFDDAQRLATKDAARLAGIHVLRLLNEPTAAAIAYGLDQSDDDDRLIAVYDFGGGTFDISILHLRQGVFKVLATGGDSALGGDDIDHAIAEWVLEQCRLDVNTLPPEAARQLMASARQAKEALTDKKSITICWESWQGELCQKTLYSLAEALVKKTLKACKRALRDAGVKASSIDEVIMVGGSTRMPCIQQQVEILFGKAPLTRLDPDKVVAIGAAIQSNVLVGNAGDNEPLLLDVVPLSLGLETMGGLTEKIIHRNATIPLAKAQEFTTHKEGQTAMVIHVLQGERELVKDNRSLARFTLRGIPPMPAGMARIRVTFQVDADGLLSVTAREESSGVAASIEVKPSYGLKDEEVMRMLEASCYEASADKKKRALREQQVEAERLLEALTTALEKDGNTFLSSEERQEIHAAMKVLAEQKSTETNASVLRETSEKLGHLSETFAARRMNAGVRNMLSGHSIDEFKE